MCAVTTWSYALFMPRVAESEDFGGVGVGNVPMGGVGVGLTKMTAILTKSCKIRGQIGWSRSQEFSKGGVGVGVENFLKGGVGVVQF